jgi:hypothetical protein
MRSAISYVMSNEALSLDRLRSKFAAKMARAPMPAPFAFVTGAKPRQGRRHPRDGARGGGLRHALTDFMTAYRERYPGLFHRRAAAPKTGAADTGRGETGAAAEPAAPRRG